MSVPENWQTTKPTIRERTKFLLNNDLFSDVKFVVRRSDGESESNQVIPAHKFVLSIGSPVFENMFYGELAETRDSIELPDCDYESVLELFRYMYSDEVNLSGSDVSMRVLYLAKKYMVPSLAVKCTECLQNNLAPSNVFNFLPMAEKYEERALLDQCWKVIDEQLEVAVKSDGFVTIERSLLQEIVARETLCIEEIDLFQAVDLWATKQCEKQGLAADGALKRRILGEDIIKAIRFPVLKQEEFASAVLDTGILTRNEEVTFFKFFSSKLTSPVGFPETRRSGTRTISSAPSSPSFLPEPERLCSEVNVGSFPEQQLVLIEPETRAKTVVFHRCDRFESVIVASWGYGRGRKDFLGVTVDKDVTLHGLCLFGSENNNYTVSLEIKDASDIDNLCLLVSKSGTFSSKLLQYKREKYHGFEVLFDSPVDLKKNIKYQIEALICGPMSGNGVSGSSTFLCNGVTFTFLDYTSRLANGTSSTVGQFPEFLFSV